MFMAMTISTVKSFTRPVVKVAKDLGVKAYKTTVKALKSMATVVKNAVKGMDPIATIIRMLG